MRDFRCCFLISSVFALVFTVGVVAQQAVPIGWQMDAALSSEKAKFFTLLRANNIDSDRQGVERFFDNYYFSRWTLPTATGSVRGYSQELLVQDFRDLAGGARDYLLNKSFDSLRKMTADQTLTPTARYNAIYTIGLLNQRDAPNASTPPVPYGQALPYLAGEFDNKDVTPDYLRLGALHGIYRHAVLGIADAEMRETTLPASLIKAVQDGKPTPNRDADEQEILDGVRTRAIETLGALKSTGQRGEVVDLLLGVIEDAQETSEIRCFAARILSDLNFQAANTAGVQINYQRVGTILLSLGKAICDIELRRVEEVRNKEKAKAGVRLTPIGGVDADPDFANLPPEAQQEVTNAVQRIKTEFFDIMNGIRGPRSTGMPTVGVLSVLPSDDPVAVKLNRMTRAISQLFDFLDKGPADRPAPQLVAPMGDGEMPPRGAAAANPNMLKVNLGLIRDKLQEFSEIIDAIIAG